MVVDDPVKALEASRDGTDVVVILAPGAAHIPLAAAGPGRVAVLVGMPDDPSVSRAASEMHRELFGPRS